MSLKAKKSEWVEYYYINKKPIKNAVISFGDHLLAMFPATVLMPILINQRCGHDVFDISIVLIFVGIGTIFFTCITKIPAVLSSSFAFIGMSVYVLNAIREQNPQIPIHDLHTKLYGAYFISGIALLVLYFVFNKGKEKKNQFIEKWIPPAVRGPAISLIGLELVNDSAEKAGLIENGDINSIIISLSTVMVIILFAVIKNYVLSRAFIVFGVLVGCIFSVHFNMIDWKSISETPFWTIPQIEFFLPTFDFKLMWVVIPPTLVLFCEHLARIEMLENLKYDLIETLPNYDNKINKYFPKSLMANSIPIIISSFFGSPPATIYAENIAVLRIKKEIQWQRIPIIIAAILCIIMSIFNRFQAFLNNIPIPVIGGLSLILMGIIATPGIKLLVEKKVDYRKTTNLLLTSSVFISGISGITVPIVGIKGMGLGILVGICLNCLFIILEKCGCINNRPSNEEIVELCKNICRSQATIIETNDKQDMETKFFVGTKMFLRLIIKKSKLTLFINYCSENKLLLLKHTIYSENNKEIMDQINDIENISENDITLLVKNVYKQILSDTEKQNMNKSNRIQDLKNNLSRYVLLKQHDVFAIEVINEAILANENGNFGVGAILVNNETNEIEYRGQNKVFSESRSDLHAEMDLLNAFEMMNKENSRELIKKYTLFTSLESCPMCLCRIITSGILKMYHIADDPTGGMVCHYDKLPLDWQEISKGRVYKKADCSDELSAIAKEIFLLTNRLNDKL